MKNKINPWLIWTILLGVCVLAAGGVFAMRQVQSRKEAFERQLAETAQAEDLTAAPEKWQEGVISYDGKNYKFNNNLHIYLMMGIDNDEVAAEAKDSQSGGQSDAMFLLIANTETEELSVVAINRNTMTDIYVTNAEGQYLSTVTAQICLQHAYGDGRKLSCTRAREAVQNLFYQLPISGYFAMNMGGIPAFNDAIGGVELTSLQDLDSDSRNVHIKEGQQINLMGDEAYVYLRLRDTGEYASADKRLARQKQYIDAYITKAKAEGSASSAAAIYTGIADYLVTDVNFENVLKELMEYDYSETRMYEIPGETKMGEIYEEYWVDEKAFYEMNLKLFYTEVDE